MKCSFCSTLAFIFLLSAAAFAQNQEVLKPLLTDLTGWKAEPAEGMSMDMGTMKMTNATRQYEKGDATVSAVLMVGNNAMTQGQFGNMNMDSDRSKVIIKEMNGFKTTQAYDKQEGSGNFMVFLSQKGTNSGFLAVTYEGISMQEAEKIAKKFDWNKMKKAVEKLF